MSPLTLYRPPLTRHLYRCRQYSGGGTLLHDAILLSPTIQLAMTRYLADRRCAAQRHDSRRLGPWWVDVTLFYEGWVIGRRRLNHSHTALSHYGTSALVV